MSKVIVTGHGGYATAMRRNLAMLVGELEGFYFVDFNESARRKRCCSPVI